MICVQLSGGLGNQMFQYACGRALAYKHKVCLILDLEHLEKNSSQPTHALREYELGIFLLNARKANVTELKLFKPSRLSLLNNKLSQMIGFPRIFNKNLLIENKYIGYNRRIETLPKKCTIMGYWQSEQYFINIKVQIRKDFQFKPTLDIENDERKKKITSTNSISIHIRRGDYAERLGTKIAHGLCSLDYYNSAIKFLLQKINNPYFFIFSDDLNWVKQNLKIPHDHEFISGNVGNNSFVDMQLMSLCRNNIISNSTFSWWGAWLNPNPDKVVIAPEQWFNDKTKNAYTDDLIPNEWVRI